MPKFEPVADTDDDFLFVGTQWLQTAVAIL